MKRIYLTLGIAFAFFNSKSLIAQDYGIIPGKTVDTFLSYHGPGNSEVFEILLPNLTGDTIFFEYTTLVDNKPSSWQVLFCDFSACQTYVPAGRIMDPVVAAGHGLLHVALCDSGYSGSAHYSFRMWDHTGSQMDTLNFNITSFVGIEETQLEKNMISPTLHPEKIFIHNSATMKNIRFMNVNGEIVEETKAAPAIDVAGFAPGMYFVLADGKAIGKFVK